MKDIFDISVFLPKLEKKINFNKDLPNYIFEEHDYKFWFFERPIIDYKELLFSFFKLNYKYSKEPIFVSFGKPRSNYFDYFYFDEVKEYDFYNTIAEVRDDYPIVITPKNFDWILFESVSEEMGVIALNKDTQYCHEFIEFLDGNFISMDKISEMAVHSDWYGKLANILLINYSIN